jgi:hypothetical protein
MNCGTGSLLFGNKETWQNETSLSSVAMAQGGDVQVGPKLVYAYEGTDGVGGVYVGMRP